MIAFVVTLLLTWSATWILTRAAGPLGLMERVFEGESSRKNVHGFVPVVGGVAILFALIISRLLFGELALPAPASSDFAEPWTWAALTCAFMVGLGDDCFGFRPRTKLLGQLLAGTCLVMPLASANGFSFEVFAWLFGAMVAQNAINTFDNADGAATSLVAVGLLGPAPIVAAAVAGFLPLNLAGSRDARNQRPLLGDAGSHVLGLLVLLNPVAWPVLCLPLLDLARVSWVRMRLGIAPWMGDRRHLAHRLELANISRGRVVGVLLGVAAPTLLAASFAQGDSAWILALGVLATTGLFVVAVQRSPDPDRLTVLQSQPPRTAVPQGLQAQRSPQERASVAPVVARERPRSASSLVR